MTAEMSRLNVFDAFARCRRGPRTPFESRLPKVANVTLEAVELTKRYGARTALQAVSFTAFEGDVVGLLGPNGAGKTTTIRVLTTVLEPSSGHFSVGGQPSSAPTEIRRRIGVLPENGGYPGHQTGREYLRYFARLYGMGSGVARGTASRLLADVGLEERAGSPIHSYSQGMRRRLGIARALINNPSVVFLDEPTLGLDPAVRVQVLDIVRNLAERRGVTVVLSTHTLPEVEEVCSKVLILDNGRVQASGSVADVIRTARVEPSARLRVPMELVERARQALDDLPGFSVEQAEGRPDVLRIALRPRSSARPSGPDAMNAALTAVTDAGVPVLSFEVDGARLSDAFLTMTGGAGT
jgi:ABC-2 type transport system ATP-binding protein